MSTKPSITAFFPAYNDGGTIGSLVVTTLKTLEELTDDYEVIVVENGSTDYTVEVLEELAEQYDHFRFYAHRQALGYGGALRVGFAKATKELIFYTDGDAQYDPRELKLLLPALADDVDIVNGWKIDRSDPLHRKIIGRVYHHTVKLLFGFKLRDVDCDFRLVRREVFDVIDLESDSGTICLELVKKLQDAGFRFAEVPVHHYHRTYGQSQFFNFPRLWRTGIQLIQLWFKLVVRREHMPRINARKNAKLKMQNAK
jgi:glycosyltransferase involved in cell wall biosynthesis